MGDTNTNTSSLGALVPSVKEDMKAAFSESDNKKVEVGGVEVADKDLLCPICMQIIKDAFLTACGHSFCYMCIVTHLNNKNDCPCCSHYLTHNQLFPNFLLDKLLKKTSARQIAKAASPVEHLRLALQQTGL